MIHLIINDFSCIKSARFEVAPVTVLIGPQGSGKSVTTKLNYFFCDILIRQYSCAEKGLDLDDFKKDTARQFRLWFPPGAWGNSRFNINFYSAEFEVRILRRMSKGAPADDVSVNFSGFFEEQYRALYQAYADYRAREDVTDERSIRRSMEGSWKLREQSERSLFAHLGDSYVSSQTFIPAGRAFFTSIGRLVAAIEQGSSLDPVTIRFAKIFANVRDLAGRRRLHMGANEVAKESIQNRRKVMAELFGGEIKFENELEYVETGDGRKVPFSVLSSGQQELLPMWLLVDLLADRIAIERPGADLFYIEEPEAHLFPAAQSVLMDFLIGTLVSRQDRRSLILTTHSPYILSKLNVYLKAGDLGRTKRHQAAVSNVISRDCWLTPARVKAYAIEDGTLIDLMDADGLIDAAYIDQVSEEVGRNFGRLLDIQYPETAA